MNNREKSILISIGAALAAIGIGYLFVYFIQQEITDPGEFLNGLFAIIIMEMALIGLSVYYLYDSVKPIDVSSKNIKVVNPN
jgi:F0F1-type ATP synthase membrane subunit c/vacuolar-type H+-ATPase subunit K